MSLTQKTAKPAAITATNDFPPDFPMLTGGKAMAAFPELVNWSTAMAEWWKDVLQALLARDEAVISPVNVNINNLADISAEVTALQAKLAAIQTALASPAPVVTPTPALPVSSFGKAFIQSADLVAAKAALGLSPGQSVVFIDQQSALVADNTSLFPAAPGGGGSPPPPATTSIDDVTAAFDQTILNRNFHNLVSQLNMVVTDLATALAFQKSLASTAIDQNLVAPLIPPV